jgi:hypothetical protein
MQEVHVMRALSASLTADLRCCVQREAQKGAVRVMALSEALRQRHASDNIALEDIVAGVVHHAVFLQAAVEFDAADVIVESSIIIPTVNVVLH